MAFNPSNVQTGEISTMTITLSNSNFSAITGVQFTDMYPTGIVNAWNGVSLLGNSCGGTVVAAPNGGSVSLFDGSIEAQGFCSIEISVVGTSAGSFVNHTGVISSTNAPPGVDAAATLDVANDAILAAPTLSKSFTPSAISVGALSQMTITLTNPNLGRAVTGAQFTDAYPGGMINVNDAMPSALVSNTCGGTITADANALSTTLADGVVPPGGSCSVVVNLVGTAQGTWTNQTSSITSANAVTGSGASAVLTENSTPLLPSPTVTKTFSPNNALAGGISQMTIALANPNAGPVVGAQFLDFYPSGMTNAPSGVVVSNSCAGTVVADPAGISASLSNGTIPPGGGCSVVINVVASSAGSFTNWTGQVFSGNAQAANSASGVLTAVPGALLAGPVATKAFAPTNVPLGGTSQMTIALANPNPTAITGAQFTDSYPSGMVNAPNAVVSNSCGGNVTALANDASTVLTGGTIPANGSCDVVVDVVATAVGSLLNHTGAIASANAQSGADATATLTVSGSLLGAPAVAKAFAPAGVVVGGTSTMTIALTNPNNSAISGVQFTDTYPTPLHMANAPGVVVVSNSCGGSVTAAPNGVSTALSNGSIPAGGECSVVVSVVGTSVGTSINQTGSVLSNNAAPGNSSSAMLTVTGGALLVAPTVTKAFSPASVSVGGTSQMTIALANNDLDNSISGVFFNDVYPPGMSNAASGGAVSNTCNGTISATPHGTSVAMANGTIPAGGTCEVTINVVGAAVGSVQNHTGPVTSSNADVGVDATATLTVVNAPILTAPTVAKAFSPSTIVVGDTAQMTITLTNNDPNSAVVGAQFTDMYPFGMASASGTVADNTCGGMPTVSPFALELINGTIPPGGSCSVIVDVTGTAAADVVNHTGSVLSANALDGADADALLTVIAAGGQTPQTITFTSMAPNDAKVAGPAYLASAVASSGLPVVLTIDGSSATVCTINAGTVSFIGAGTCTIDANQGGDATYAPAPEMQQSFPVDSAGGVAPQAIAFTSVAPNNAVVAGSTYLATATASSGLPVVLTIDGSSATVCTISNGTVSFIGAGLCTIDANQGGDATYAAASQVQQSFNVASAGGVTPQTVVFTSTAPVDALVGGPAYFASATASSGLPVVLTIDAVSATVCAINNGWVSFIGAGPCVIDANQGGDATYAAASQVQQSFDVASAGGASPQTISFASVAPMDAVVGGPTYLATATASSGLPVVLTIDTVSNTICTINNGTVSFIGGGTCTIDANQGGDVTYAPAPQVQQSFPVAFAGGVTPQSITFTSAAPNNAQVGGPAYQAAATASSSLPVVLTIDAASDTVCTIDNGTVSFIGAGICTIDADQGGDATYAPAPRVQQPFPVAPAGGMTPQAITFTSAAPLNAAVNGPTYLATAVASSGLPVVLTIDAVSNTVCTINSGTVSFIGAGTCTIDADQGGDATYAPAPQMQQSFAVAESGAPTVSCVLPHQVDVVGDMVNLDLSLLFTAPPGQSLSYSGTNLPPSLSIVGSLLSGTLQASDAPGSPYAATLQATAVPGGVSASEDVIFQVLPTGEILLRNGFDGASSGTPCP